MSVDISEKSPLWEFIDNNIITSQYGALPQFAPEVNSETSLYFGEYLEFVRELPNILYSGAIRLLIHQLPLLPLEDLWESDEESALLMFRDLSFIVSAYAWNRCIDDIDQPHETHIPAHIAQPLWILAKKLGIPPILSYFFYAMSNFEIVDPALPISFENTRLIRHFTISPHDTHESGFILPHDEIEAEAGPGLVMIPAAHDAVLLDYPEMYISALAHIRDALITMAGTLRSIPSVCSPDVYYIHVRPWIFYFQNITYEGVGFFEKIKGETGAQSVAPLSFDAALGVGHTHTQLTDHLDELKKYRPLVYQQWLSAIRQGPSLKEYAEKNKGNPAIKNVFNEANSALVEFRKDHLRLAVQYIKEKGRGDIATGATHYERFLGQLIKDTENNKVI